VLNKTYCRFLILLSFFFLCFGFVSIVGASDVTIEMEQYAQVSSTPSSHSHLDWRDIDWKDPFVNNGVYKPHVSSNESPSGSHIKLELKMPSPTSMIQVDAFDDLEDPFASKLNTPEMSDPFEDYNRFMFDFNQGFYDNLMKPVVTEYRDSVDEDIRIGIANIFDNAMAPLKLVSSFLQGDFDKTGRVLGRTIINTTLGLGGMFDIADKVFDIKDVNEDLDQVLGTYGVPTGPYIMLPFFGPSYARNIVGRIGASFLSPTFHFSPGIEVAVGLSATDELNDTSFIVDDIDQMDDSTIDKYESVRDFYGQYRNVLVNE
jgi:phospholipid-binding lipoprotein MlaA